MNDLIDNMDKIHTTQLGLERIQRNLELEISDVAKWCKEKIENAENIMRKGKNWYVHVEGMKITINAHSYTIITAHKEKVKSVLYEV